MTSFSFFILFSISNAYWSEKDRNEAEENKNTLHQISRVIEESISTKVALTKSVASFVKSNPNISQEKFNSFAIHLYEAAKDNVISIQLTKDSIISFNYPSKGNESTIGVNILDIETNNQYVKDAYRKKEKMSIGPRILIQNRLGLVYREPIILDNADSTLWGYAVLVLSIENIMNGIPIVQNNIRDMALYSYKVNSGKGGFFLGNKNITQIEHIVEEIRVPLDTWNVYYSPPKSVEKNPISQELLLVIYFFISLLIGTSTSFLIRSFLNTKRHVSILKLKNKTIENQLEEKSILIREIHHRIKNHFQMLSSLNKLLYLNSKDEELSKVIEDINSRVYSMASVYDQLSLKQSNRLEIKPYLESLCQNLSRSIDKGLDIEVICDDCELDVKRTITIGVILTEMITNSIKHAFTKTEQPRVKVHWSLNDGIHEMKVMDNGGKLPIDILEQETESQGMELIKLISSQLNATIKVVAESNWIGFELHFID